MSESIVQILPERGQLGAVTTGQPVLFPPPSGAEPFPNHQPDPPLMQFQAIPLGPVAVTRKQRSVLPFHSAHPCAFKSCVHMIYKNLEDNWP